MGLFGKKKLPMTEVAKQIAMLVVRNIGEQFCAHVGSNDPGLKFWASSIFSGFFKSNVEFLKGLDSQLDLVP